MCGSSDKKQISGSIQTVPEWIQDSGNQVFSQAASKFLNGGGFTPYEQPRVADVGADFNTGRDRFTSYAAAPTDTFDVMRGGLKQIMADGSPDKTVQDYMNPHLEGVLSPMLRKIREQAAMSRNDIGAQATMAGAFGDSRHGVTDALNRRDEATLASDVTGQQYSQAFDKATADRNNSLSRFMQAISGMGGVQQQQDGRENNILNTLLGLDNTKRGIEQGKLDASYGEFMRGQTQPLQEGATLMQILNGTPYSKQTTQIGKSSEPNTGGFAMAGSLLGGGGAGGGMLGSLGSGIGSALGAGASSIGTALGSFLPLLLSDERAKTDIEHIMTAPDGQKIYRYRYKHGGPVHIGLMAQEVASAKPHAVGILPGGFLGVDYEAATAGMEMAQ